VYLVGEKKKRKDRKIPKLINKFGLIIFVFFLFPLSFSQTKYTIIAAYLPIQNKKFSHYFSSFNIKIKYIDQ
jgi:hypothetical protein